MIDKTCETGTIYYKRFLVCVCVSEELPKLRDEIESLLAISVIGAKVQSVVSEV